MTTFEVAAITVSVGGLFAGWYFRRRTQRLKKYKTCADIFFKKTQTVLADPDTPAEVLRILQFLNRHITAVDAASSFVRSIVIYRNNRELMEKAREKTKPELADIDAFFGNRPGLKQAFYEATAAGLLAISYNSGWFGFWGFIARRGILGLVREENEIAPGVVRSYARREPTQGQVPPGMRIAC